MSQEQQDIADLKAWRKVTEPALRELAADSKTILSQLADILAKMANHQTCPAPAQCNALELRVRVLENAQLSQTSAGWGIWKTLSVIAAIAAAAPLSAAAVVEVIKVLRP
jgi:hypothetical protein